MHLRYLLLAAGLAFLFDASPVQAAGVRYDVSYLWHQRVDSVQAYRQQVSRVLGPRVTSQLRVVKEPRLYGLIYHRRGDGVGASRVARAHTKRLRARGLEAAAPVRSKAWSFVSADGTARRPSGSRVVHTSSEMVSELRDLESAVEAYIKRLRSKGKIAADERTAWSVYDFTTGEKLVDINEDVQFQAASLVKPFFALAFFHKVREGRLVYGNKSRRHMERMIQHSSNRSTNWIIRHVGGPAAVHRLLRQRYAKIFRDTRIVEYIPSGGRTYRNKASVHDYSRFLYALWKEDLPGAREIKRLMALPGSDRLYTGARDIPAGTQVYNKTGSTARLCGDMGILVVADKEGNKYPYTLVGVIEKRQRARSYTSWIRARGDVIRGVSTIIYRGISQHHNLAGTL